MPYPLTLKPKPAYVDLDADFQPLPKHGHLTRHHEEYAAVRPAIDLMYDRIWALPDFDAFRQVGRGADAAVPHGGPDRARDVVTEVLRFPARDGCGVELKVYKSPKVREGAGLMLRMHGGGWCVGDHEADGAENVYAAARHDIVVVSVDYRLYVVIDGF
ncbi:hypothetical protein PG985_007513 [Apiospora marii]|uniref:Alpha/beta hydrolase fold-3 domain-containing protein n=1 Tax=Apiospora marii TaxID=335849 RepID=A0ABR1SNP6_9PEZI